MMTDFLLVDDNETFARLLCRGFKRRGLNLEWAATGEQALALPARFQGILLDLNLDGESGLQLLPALVAGQPEARIVVLTGYASISTAIAAIKLGAVQYLPKPAEIDAILAAFEEEGTEQTAALSIEEVSPSLRRHQWEYVQFVLQQHEGNISATARALGMHRRSLQRMLQKHAVSR
ncbi:response regulator transcription factor [Oceanimonas sp. MB9]|uniref:response regulator transcription factor n=1 Tax=Oceanimonas sp. MB9 TaxID=2588453 RepID=UPI0013F65177|nr:response regulator [Oceanimonas sp. MB9]NHI01117.1 Photosynthetic apparatus regulatory protein RegA [Oceanimonas sp. MB9]